MPDMETHPRTFRQSASQFAKADSFGSNTLSLDSNFYKEVFRLGIDQGEAYLLGRGQTANPQQAEGHLALRLMDDTSTTAVQITGDVRITVRTQGSRRLVQVLEEGDLQEYDSRDASDNLKNVENRRAFPLTDDEFTTHEYIIVLEVKPDADDTIDTSPDSGNTEIYADGHKVEKTG